MADSITDCADAVERGDVKTARQLAESILVENTPRLPDSVDHGKECLQKALGEDYGYEPARAKFMTSKEIKEDNERQRTAKAAVVRAERSARDAELLNMRIAAFEAAKAALEDQKKAAALAESYAILDRVTREVEKRQQAVSDLRSEACRALYRRDRYEAVLHPRCFEVFMATGLPEN